MGAARSPYSRASTALRYLVAVCCSHARLHHADAARCSEEDFLAPDLPVRSSAAATATSCNTTVTDLSAASINSNWVTVAIKHTSGFDAKQKELAAALESIAARYPALSVLVAVDADEPPDMRRHFGSHAASVLRRVRWLTLPRRTGLSEARNRLVQEVSTPLLLLMDDDVQFTRFTRLDLLLEGLQRDPCAALAAGCMAIEGTELPDCYALDFDAQEDGIEVHTRAVRLPGQSVTKRPGCVRAHMVHNFFLARTESLRRFKWDPRQKVLEHET